jgi:hypothetical protein
MKFSKTFRLNLSQPELDFVDVDLDGDMRLFIDPYALVGRPDELSRRCTSDIQDYFQVVLDCLKRGDRIRLQALMANLREPNETRLGLSRGLPRGSGVGTALSDRILAALSRSKAIETGLIRDLSDTELLIEGIGADKISDLATNIIRRHLIHYTQAQCGVHGIPMIGTIASGPLWNSSRQTWEQGHVRLPIVDGKKVVLVPKSFVRWRSSLDPREYYQHYVLNYIQQEEFERPGSSLVRVLKDGERRPPSKKSLFAINDGTKADLLDFSARHPQVLDEYRARKKGLLPLTNKELIDSFDAKAFAAALAAVLPGIALGSTGETEYHRFMVGLLSFLFYPNLIYPETEERIHEGRKRIDITYVNGALSGLFERFGATTRLAAVKIMVECKNYTDDLGNKETDQLSGRFGPTRGWLGILACRQIDDRARLMARCRDTARDGRGFIIPVDDADVLSMLRHVEAGKEEFVDAHMTRIYSELLK